MVAVPRVQGKPLCGKLAMRIHPAPCTRVGGAVQAVAERGRARRHFEARARNVLVLEPTSRPSAGAGDAWQALRGVVCTCCRARILRSRSCQLARGDRFKLGSAKTLRAQPVPPGNHHQGGIREPAMCLLTGTVPSRPCCHVCVGLQLCCITPNEEERWESKALAAPFSAACAV